MEISTFSNDFATDVRGTSSSARSLSTIEYAGPYRVITATGQRPTTTSLVLPSSTRESCVAEANKSDTVVSIGRQPVKLTGEVKEEDMPILCSCVYEIVRLLCWAFCATLVAIFAFMWIFYAFDVYWLARLASNDSSVMWLNDTMPALIEEATIDYDDQY